MNATTKKKRKLRKPSILEIRDAFYPHFDCDIEEGRKIVFYDYCYPLTLTEVKRMAKWFTNAAAWLKEQGDE